MMGGVFAAPTIWVHDATVMLGAICFLFGGAYALQRRDHIRITFLYDALPRPAQRACDLIGLVTGLIYLLGLGWFSHAAMGELPYAPIVVVLLMMAVLIALRTFMHWVGMLLLTMPMFVQIIKNPALRPGLV
jgi:TRAP-type C4-dicarboxylate transport system permease small subunit